MAEQDFIQAGFTVLGTDAQENKLLRFLKENYPSVLKDNEIDLNELKAIAGLPIDDKTNGYGLNFVGRSYARAKYNQKTEKALRLNTPLSKNIDTTQNLVLKGDNLDSLKILKNHYTGKIKCIYIDPPYNTTSDEFVYPDKFDKEEAEVLGLANLSPDDYARMDFSFKSKKSHNGWLAFMYPRLLLARDLLSKDGVIFISIDDNEQANLKLLCDDIFGEENFVANLIWQKKYSPQNDAKWFSNMHDHILCYSKNKEDWRPNLFERTEEQNARYSNPDNDIRGNWKSSDFSVKTYSENYDYSITTPSGRIVNPPPSRCWRTSKNNFDKLVLDNRIWFGPNGSNVPSVKKFLNEVKQGVTPSTIWFREDVGDNQEAAKDIRDLFIIPPFDTPKPIRLIDRIVGLGAKNDDIILDFFAGSGSTGHAVMQLNAEDGGNRKFILCQIDEPIKEDKPAYKFCIENNLPPFISSVTIERVKRAGEKIKKEVEDFNTNRDMFETEKQLPDIGFKVFNSTEATKLVLDEASGQIAINYQSTDALSRIYNMIFTVGLDEPTQVPEEVVKDSIYKIGSHFYITNSENISKEDFTNAIKSGKVYIDGWTASVNGTLQNFKEDVKIIF